VKDFYDILGVSKAAPENDIKRAYRKIAMKYHPDRNPDNKDAEKKFKEAAEAYSVLSDASKRRQYDQFGHSAFNGMGGGGQSGFNSMNMDDIFNQFGDIFGGNNPFESFFSGGGRRASSQPRSGSDIKVKISVSYAEIVNGGEKKIKIRRLKLADNASFSSCQMCGGAGQVTRVTNSFLGQMRSTSVCPECEGYGKKVNKIPSGADKNGMIKKEETIKIKIPTGVEDGNYMTLKSQGHEDINQSAGDLYVFFEEEEHEHFSRYGNDVLLQIKVGYSQVVFGDKVDIPTINGHASLKIPSGLQPGQILRIKGKGFPGLGKTGRGDQLIKVQVEVPKQLSREEKRIIKEYYDIEKDKDIKFEKFED
tara:strand:+ start:325 stop:1416 length:1092 start_codon:yes stop_codon:yes gene_type:complete